MNAHSAYLQVKHGGRDELVVSHAALVKRIAYHMILRLPANVDVNDLIQVGMIGLLEAASHFERDKGASFETFAAIRIRGAMIDEVRREGWVPRSVMRRVKTLGSAIRKVENRTGRQASGADVAREMGISLDEYHVLLQDAGAMHVASLDSMGDDDGASFDVEDRNAQTPLAALLDADFQRDLVRQIESLPEREQMVMSLYYEKGLNLKEIGLVLEVSESRVCQLHSQAVVRLRHRLEEWREQGVPA